MSANPEMWSREDIELAKEAFSAGHLRGRPGRDLVWLLWGHWRAAGLGQPFFGQPEQDMALALHARAHGLVRPEDWERLDDVLGPYMEWQDPLGPPPLSLGPGANLAPELGAALDSQVMDAWIIREDASPVKVLIVGAGVPQIADEVSTGAFMLSLRSGTLDTELIGTGIVRVDLGSVHEEGIRLPVNPLGRGAPYQPEAGTAREAMADFVAGLIDLANRTGIMRIHEADDAGQREMLWRLRELAENDEDTVVRVWAPAAGEAAPPRVAALLPYLRLPGGDVPCLRLSRDLLASPAYQYLTEIYLGGMLGRIIADIEARHLFHASEISRLTREHDSYEKASKEDRRTLWGDTVYINFRYDFETDVAIRLAFPLRRDPDAFYLTEIPQQIKKHQESVKRMAGILQAIGTAADREDQPTDRLTAGRFFDGATCGRVLAPTTTQGLAYATWRDQIAPMLSFEWRRLLKSYGIDPADVFTRHTVMQTFLTYEEIVMVPCTLVDQQHSVVLLDPDRGVTVALDATDRAEATDRSEPEDPAAAEQAWNDLAAAANVSQEKFDADLVSLLRSAPRATVRRILQALTAGPEGAEYPSAAASRPSEVPDLERAIDGALSATALSRLLNRALEAEVVNARHTARLLLAELSQLPGLSGRDKARIALAEAVVEYRAGGQPGKPFKAFKDPAVSDLREPFHGRFRQAVGRARAADADYAGRWIALLKNAEFARVIRQLLDGLQEPREILRGNNVAYAALASRTGAEAAALAREITEAASRLSPSGEAPVVPFAKLGLALESIFLAEFAGGHPLGSVDLLEILTGIGVQTSGTTEAD